MSLVSINTYPVKPVLKLLLTDKTTKRNILIATNAYEDFGAEYAETSELTPGKLVTMKILPRVEKDLEAQRDRTRSKAEVFTPSWVCNKMNNHCDEEWFGRKDVFNAENGQSWITNKEKIEFGELSWQDYVDSRRIEITCGEAPYITSRYDTTTGDIIPIEDRIGILDRKLRVIGENARGDAEWNLWAERAFQSVYGYEFQGDNLLIARINLLNTYVDYYTARMGKQPDVKEVRKIANIIVWNFWQMDGISGTIPFGTPEDEQGEQIGFFDTMVQGGEEETPVCRIYDWRSKESIKYTDLRKGNR